jgi:hypothetical protein
MTAVWVAFGGLLCLTPLVWLFSVYVQDFGYSAAVRAFAFAIGMTAVAATGALLIGFGLTGTL